MASNRNRVIQLLAERLGIPPEQVADQFPFIDELGVDSLDVEELALELEEEFGNEG